jgi:nucleoside-diphosphate-sugar epimerase
MSSILVTGASGFVGKPLVERLVRDGADVHAVSTQETHPNVRGIHWHRLDLRDTDATARLLRDVRPERLVHLAWYVEHGKFWDASENLDWVVASLQLARAFADAGGRRAVMLGSCAEYDWTAAGTPLREGTSPVDPATFYGVCKDSLHRAGTAFAAKSGFEFAWGRLFFLYGPREAPGRLVSSVARSLLAGEPVDTTSGTQRRDFMHVDDVAGALAALALSHVEGAVNIATGEAWPVARIVEEIAIAAGRPDQVRLGALPDRAGEPELIVADVTRLREEVGFSPRRELAQGIADTVDWWRERSGHADGR